MYKQPVQCVCTMCLYNRLYALAVQGYLYMVVCTENPAPVQTVCTDALYRRPVQTSRYNSSVASYMYNRSVQHAM